MAAIRFFLYIRFFLNAPLDLLLVVLTLSRSLAPHFTVVHFIVVRGVVFPLHVYWPREESHSRNGLNHVFGFGTGIRGNHSCT